MQPPNDALQLVLQQTVKTDLINAGLMRRHLRLI